MRDDVERLDRNKNTLRNWDALYPAVRPVLFVPQSATNNSLADLVRNITKHWKILETPYWKSGRPVLKGMFKVLEEVGYNTSYIGFSNGDILFDRSISETLADIVKWNSGIISKYTLITGQRRNVDMVNIPSPKCLDCMSQLVSKTGLFTKYAQDYFIMTKAGFPWQRCPDHVIGDTLFDNWILGAANAWSDVTVIDASMTLNAFHETGKDGVYSGHRHGNKVNVLLTPNSERFYLELGDTSKVNLKTWHTNKTCPASFKCVPVNVSVPRPHRLHHTPRAISSSTRSGVSKLPSTVSPFSISQQRQ